MASELARLGLFVDSSGVVRATKELKKLETQGGKTEKKTEGITRSFSKMKGVIVGLGLTILAREIVNTNRSFESLRASLETATGSADNALVAFRGIQEFAAETPFAVEEVTTAFIRLANLGLAPTERALTSYGNTAGAMSKNILDVVEAVADATTGEFERLKEFGIKASSEGDRVRFTFRGITTEVGKNASEIQDYLIGLGETEFAGGMERQANTLNGAISNLGDSWDNFIDNLLDSESEGKITKAVQFVGSAIDWLDSKINSTELDSLNSEIATLEKRLTQLSDYSDNSFSRFFMGSDDEINAEFNLLNNRLEDAKNKRDELLDSQEKGTTFDGLAQSLDKVGTSSDKTSGKLTEQEKALKKLKEAYRDLTSDLSNQITMLGMTEREAFIYEAQLRLSANATDDMRANVERLAGRLYDEQQALEQVADAELARNQVLADGVALTEAMRTPMEAYLAQLERIDELADSAAVSEETAARARQKAFEDMKASSKDSADEMTKFMEKAAENMQDAMADGFFDLMQGDFDNLGDSFKRTIDRMVADLLASQLLSFLVGDFGSTGQIGGAIGDIIGSFGGARAEGGPVTGGTPYLVGERGPELIVPKSSGTVIPNNKLTGSQSVVVNINVSGIQDTGGLQRTAAQIAQQSGLAAQRALARNG